MTDEGLGYSLQNLLTNLATRVGSLEGSMKTFMENWARQDQLAHDARRTLYERVDLLSRQIERVATDVQNIVQDVAELKKEIEEEITPAVEAVEWSKQRRIGAKSVWAMFGGAIVAFASLLAFLFDKIAAHIWPRP